MSATSYYLDYSSNLGCSYYRQNNEKLLVLYKGTETQKILQKVFIVIKLQFPFRTTTVTFRVATTTHSIT